jgi:predicted O-linked N-acetylglucosamine transferase (SPINDLY family)
MRLPTIELLLQAAEQHESAGRLAEAETLYRKALEQDPNHLAALHSFALLAFRLGRPEIAARLLTRAVALQPQNAQLSCELGNMLQFAGRFEAAIDAYENSLRLAPNSVRTHYNLGLAQQSRGNNEAAVAAYENALALHPGEICALVNLGNALMALRKWSDAADAYRKVLRVDSDHAPSYNNLGVVLQAQGLLEEAIEAGRESVRRDGASAEGRYNLGKACWALGRVDEAIESAQAAIAANPGYAPAYNLLGNCQKDVGRLAEAVECYRTAVNLEPGSSEWQSNVVYSLHFHTGAGPRSLLAEALEWDRRHAQPLKVGWQRHRNDFDPDRRLRIGYVSPDFCRHVLGQSVGPLLREHDRARFEVFCYAAAAGRDAVTDRLESWADHWREIAAVSDREAEEIIRADGIDILVDLSAHMGRNRLQLFARKPAPIQVTHLGYCSTTGLEAMDYRLSDFHLDPPGVDLACYRERTIRLERSYWCYEPRSSTPEVGRLPALENGFVTFGCLNNLAKVSPEALDTWAEILRGLPRSRLLLFAPSGRCREALGAWFVQKGIEPDRLELVGMQEWEKYASAYSRIDIGLDPFPYAGGITTLDALWMGAPVVTLSGETAVGRGGRSILTNVGLPELVAGSFSEYVETALTLAGDLPRLEALRTGLRARLEGSPLRDSKGYAREIEAAYREMWRDWCLDERRK